MEEPQHLIFDADDTLWENNVYYEAVIEAFIDFVDHGELGRAEVRSAVDRAELANIGRYGYGASIFQQSLLDCFCALRGVDSPKPAQAAEIARLCGAVHDMEMVLIDDVAATLDELGAKHHLYLLTKGSEPEQRDKIERSGLAHHFTAASVVAEKNAGAYHAFAARHDLPREATWMIGNSLRSDINPALSVGLGAVLVPHPHTWSLEGDRAPGPSERFLTVQRFHDLMEVF
ncbi:HAD family hydrolase [Streptomyces sp. 147326]|uniref:HAD family hydrolase n=1 Tax=Streptomyces sp. 147326 TaxID=3074379 RepID=UPI0038578840